MLSVYLFINIICLCHTQHSLLLLDATDELIATTQATFKQQNLVETLGAKQIQCKD